jgi:hypothetical protein
MSSKIKETNFKLNECSLSELYELDRKWLERRRMAIYPDDLVCSFSDQVTRLFSDGMDESEALEFVFLEIFG